MARTNRKVGYSPTGKLADVTPAMAARGVEAVLTILEGRWKMIILFQLFARPVLRFSELERAIAGVSQKMLSPAIARASSVTAWSSARSMPRFRPRSSIA